MLEYIIEDDPIVTRYDNAFRAIFKKYSYAIKNQLSQQTFVIWKESSDWTDECDFAVIG